MDSYEATRMVFSRIQSLEPENASKIMGYLLIQDHGEKEMIRLAFGPETLIHNLIIKAKSHLGIIPSSASTPSTPSSPSPFDPISRPNPLSISAASRLSNNGSFDISNPASPSSTAWPLSGLSSPHSPSNGFKPISAHASISSLSYASIVNNGTTNAAASESLSVGGSLSSSAFPFYANNTNITNNNCNNNANYNGDVIDHEYHHLQDHLSFLNDSKADDLFDPRLDLAVSPTAGGYTDSTLKHRSSFSVPGMCFVSDDANSGFGWKQCLYFAKGFCKNGSSCKFLHGDSVADASAAINVGSPSKLNEFEQCQELLRSKAAAQQRKLASASQFMGTAVSFPYNKCMNLLLQQQNDTPRSAAAAALMMGEELHKFGRCRPERNDLSAMGLGGSVNPGSRQIYLTFPADSTFREEDVSNYFSIYGPVQDVRIPYQQKRMFGFVTFVYPETVKLILAKGNPHFVCDSRVLVKPYKEKGKVPDKKQQHQQQQMERGEYSTCSSPSGLDSREPFDFHLGTRMFYNTQEMLLRRKLEEQADLQQAIELQGRRLMNLQLLDFKNNTNNHQHHHHQFHHGLPNGSPISSPTLSCTPNNQALIFPPDGTDEVVPEENCGSPLEDSENRAVPDADQREEVNPTCYHNNGNPNNGSKEEKSKTEESDLHESLEHILPDNLFASPKKSAGDQLTVFSTASAEADEKVTISTKSCNNTTILPSTSTLNMASLKSCFLQMPRFSSGHGTIGM